MTKLTKILLGATLGTFLGSVAITLFPNKRQFLRALKSPTNYITEKTRNALDEASQHIPMLKKQNPQKYFWSGSIFGLIAGAGTALLLAPKSGKSMRQQIVRACNTVNDKTHEVIDMLQSNSHVSHGSLNSHKKTKARSRAAQSKS